MSYIKLEIFCILVKYIFPCICQQSAENKIFISKKGDRKINFDGLPFSIDEERVLDCRYGKHYYKEKESIGKQQRFQGTKKVGCQAKIEIKKISTYPEFKLTPEQTKGKSQREKQQLQKGRLEDLKSTLKHQ